MSDSLKDDVMKAAYEANKFENKFEANKFENNKFEANKFENNKFEANNFYDNCIADAPSPEPKGFPKHYCPYCGESYYRENYVTSTAIYFPPIYKDGVNINPDRNQTSTHCTCIVCGKDFVY